MFKGTNKRKRKGDKGAKETSLYIRTRDGQNAHFADYQLCASCMRMVRIAVMHKAIEAARHCIM